jgi:hypothetical protein
MRESAVRGPAVDLSDFERRLRGEAERVPQSPEMSKRDPLTELARLMQEQDGGPYDPYQQLFDNKPAPEQNYRAQETYAHTSDWREASWDEDSQMSELRGSVEQFESADSYQHDPSTYYPTAENYSQQYSSNSLPENHELMSQELDPSYYHQTASSIGYPDQFDDPYASVQHAGAEQTGLKGLLGGVSNLSHYGLTRFTGPLRPWHAVAAVSVLAVISIGWGFAHRNGPGAHQIAIIAAPEGPMKVKPSLEAEQETSQSGAAAVLDRKETAPVKQVVSNQEQAVDPKVQPQTLKIGNDPVNAPHEPPSVAQPHRVKSVTVRPDGTPVSSAPVLPAATIGAQPAKNLDQTTQLSGATPKTPAKPIVTSQLVKPKPQKPLKESAPVSEETPVNTAEEKAAPAASGGYAVQFSAAGSEAEAKALVKSVSAKYGPDLNGRKPNYKVATVGEKTVYRVRVGGLTKEDATSICARVKESGGNCFVAGN